MKQVIEGLEEGLNAIAEAVQGGSTPIPTPTTADRGKFLGVNASNNNIGWKDAPSGLPASTSADEGKSLLVDSNGDAEWGYPHGLVPDTTLASAGDVLSINNQGSPAWTTPTGGSDLPSYTSENWGQYLSVDEDMEGNPYLTWAGVATPVREVRYFSMLSKSDFTTDGQYVYKQFLEAGEPNASYEYTMIGFGTTGVPFTYCNTANSVGQHYDDNSGTLRVYFNKADFDMIDASADITIRRIIYQ